MPRACLLAAIVITLALGSSALAANAAVTIQNATFSPASVTINAGESVTWTNLDGFDHSARADNGTFDTGFFRSGSRTATITAAGTYGYFCAVHAVMRGTVRVLGQATPPPTPVPTPPPPKIVTAQPTVAPTAPPPTPSPSPTPTGTPSPAPMPTTTPSPAPAVAQVTATPTAVATVAATSGSRAGDGPGPLLIVAAVVGLAAIAGIGVFMARRP